MAVVTAPITGAVALTGLGAVLVAAGAAVKVMKARVNKASEAGVRIHSAKSADLRGLTFPPGHPLRNVVYVGHPLVETRYVLLALFHRVLFEQKVAEAVALLAALGATRIEVQQIVGTSQAASLATSLGLPVNVVSADVGIQVGGGQASQSGALVSATLSPQEPAHVPDNLVWYRHEELWQNMAWLRLSSGLETYSLAVNYEDNFGVSAQVSAKIKDLGFDIGGDYQDIKLTRWAMKASFAPIETLGIRREG
jgi:hypothetical protein